MYVRYNGGERRPVCVILNETTYTYHHAAVNTIYKVISKARNLMTKKPWQNERNKKYKVLENNV